MGTRIRTRTCLNAASQLAPTPHAHARACACVHAGASAGRAATKPWHGCMDIYTDVWLDMCACMCIDLRASMCEGRRALSPVTGACTDTRKDVHVRFSISLLFMYICMLSGRLWGHWYTHAYAQATAAAIYFFLFFYFFSKCHDVQERIAGLLHEHK